ncbi:aminotransferase class V-fold PLP-dependent enzyme [Siphonobacter sp. SORGH_AS_1065]|uniref:aminotransferase class V-fold PLP-dependent enzyme n=1 Tax=Siphonobacter sp. SORGH_AS_1065 TaxID=3041795 RepID=UPI0027882033|nr:aminotransferase class V-fold PLP-dependent enzyme [Siphonobacter sp. SORGH_AS_1065]MDQ1088151.1 phosphoserine aminotransferase [Siphonobacter sp. SORGH_AS_1065]
MILSFYPGPSKVYPQVATYLQDAYQSGILSVNHRSAEAMEMVKETYRLLHEKLEIPAEYSIAFISSATECWEIIAQSLTRQQSLHAYNGAFGQKWAEYTQKLGVEVIPKPFDLNDACELTEDAELICLTQNETSNGTQIRMATLEKIREQTTGLIALDATSSMAGVAFNWQLGDLWFASVQKCFGLPAGLGIMIYSPRALRRAEEINERNHYNSLLFIHENAAKFQTHYTPNVLNIYLLKRMLEQVPVLSEVAAHLKNRAQAMIQFFNQETHWEILAENPLIQSDTVLAITGEKEKINQIKINAKSHGIMLGNGYGKWKENTFRIANFPALTDNEFSIVKHFITQS